jgi:Peptidase family M1 domain/Secretion system C-terminal sorting domain
MRLRYWSLIPVLAISVSLQAQPYKFGCHYFNNGEGHHIHQPQVGVGDRSGIEDVIARSDTFDIHHYDIAMDVTDYGGQTIKAATTISYTPLLPSTSITFDLRDLTVDSVIFNGASLAFTHVDALLRVGLPEATVGNAYALTVHYHGHPTRDPDWGGFYFASNYIYTLSIGLSTIPPHFGKTWYPCFDSFMERASYTYHIKSAGLFRAHCQGEFLGEVQLGGDTVVRSYDLAQEITTHVSAIAVADYRDSTVIHSGAYGDLPVTLTAKPAAINTMVGKFASIGDAIDCYEHWYGPYPYDRVGYVMATAGAMEIPENVAYPDFMNTQSLFENRGLFGHELGHHWWGDVVTPRTHNDMWFKEGPAEYSAHLLEEWAFGRDAFVNVVKDNMLYVLEQAHLQDGGFQALSPMPDAYIYGLHTYYKGAAVMHNLRGYLGDSLFRASMRAVQVNYANTTLDATGFKNALEAVSGQDLDPFFDAQIFAPGFSAFTVDQLSSQANGGNWDVQLQLRQRLRATAAFHQQVPLDITLIGANWERQEYHQVASGEFTDLAMSCSFKPVMAVLNGFNRLNQARMDHEFIARPGQAFTATLPRVAFRLVPENVVDSTLVRVEHIWAAPDADDLAWGVSQISSSHFWTVDGLWPEGTAFNGRLYYTGATADKLDFDLFETTESNALLLYRETGTDQWAPAPDYTLVAGSLTNGSGYFNLDVVHRGQYAFGKGNVIAGIADLPNGSGTLSVFPVPANDVLTVRGSVRDASRLTFDVFGSDGRLVQRSSGSAQGRFEKRMDVEQLSDGAYTLVVRDGIGASVGTARFQVKR